MFPPHIAIIGAGQLGSRHLQGLSRIDRLIDVTVVDPNQESLETAKVEFKEMSLNKFVHSVTYLESLQSLDNAIDIAIIACNADVRRMVVEELTEQVVVKYLILEKVAFQSNADFEAIITLLQKKDIKAWVNCNKRTFPIFEELCTNLKSDKKLHMVLEGGKWGLACNSIHFLDLISFLSGEDVFSIDISGLDKKVYNAKRSGFIELGGQLTVNFERGDRLVLRDNMDSNLPPVLYVSDWNSRYTFDLKNCKMLRQEEENGWIWQQVPFKLPNMSEMSPLAVAQILDTGNSDLPDLNESYKLHKPLLEAFTVHLKTVLQRNYNNCPIT